MKIVLVGPVYPFKGGIAHYTTSLAKQIIQEGHDLHVFSYNRQYPAWLYPGKSDRDSSQNMYDVKAEFTIDTLNPISWLVTFKAIEQIKPGLVIFQWWTTYMAFVFFCISKLLSTRNIPTCFLIHNIYPHEIHWFDPLLTKISLQSSNLFIVQSQKELEKLKRLLPRAKTYFHPHPNYNLVEVNLIDKSTAKRRIGLNPELPVLFFFGIVRPYKGLSLFLNAIAELKEQGVIVQGLVAGEFWENPQYYQRLIDKLGIANLVTIDNRYVPNEELDLFFSAADMLIAPYFSGTQSGVIKLAVGYKMPLIISRAIAEDSMKENTLIEIFETGDVYSLTAAIQKTLDKGNKYFLKTKSSEENYNWHSLVLLIESIFAEVQPTINQR
ncbi:MAG: glycosyltransferase [Bellilinea sp.]|jgi:glycosyltransferase involved in cell wall biosynthesis